jgi:oligosaccharide amylase
MPRDLPVCNGSLLVAFDDKYNLRELYYPHVGQYNHTMGYPSRFGVWAEGRLSWTCDEGWERSLRYEEDTLVTKVRLVHREMGLALTCHDCVDCNLDIYLRCIEIENLRGGERDVRLFWHQDFNISASREGDTAYYDPARRALIHYKGHHWFLISGTNGSEWGLSSYATGIIGHHKAQGTWRDAEDGSLGRNPIAQGSVDSVGRVMVRVREKAVAYYWICAGRDLASVSRLDHEVREVGPETILQRVRTYWQFWVTKGDTPSDLPDDIHRCYRRSLLILRTQIDNGGAILAANDSDVLQYNRDSYSYLWPRDGALVAQALDLAGYHEVTRRFFSFCAEVIDPNGYFWHKYNPDGSTGSSWHPWADREGNLQLPIQEDETALVLFALGEHFTRCCDVDYLRSIYRPLVEPAGDFLASFRDPTTHLPDMCWDLWEERRGIHTFTVASVWAGLMAASRFAHIFGDHDRARRYQCAAEEVREAADRFLFAPEQNRFLRGVRVEHRHVTPDETMDASVAGLFLCGFLGPEDPRLVATMEQLEARLWVKTEVGGLARYENDSYYQCTGDTQNVPGNPWFLCTLWLAQWRICRALCLRDLEKPMELLRWCSKHALESGVMAEQIHPYTGAPMSVSPLTWSHATYVATVCQLRDKRRELLRRGHEQTLPAAEMEAIFALG